VACSMARDRELDGVASSTACARRRGLQHGARPRARRRGMHHCADGSRLSTARPAARRATGTYTARPAAQRANGSSIARGLDLDGAARSPDHDLELGDVACNATLCVTCSVAHNLHPGGTRPPARSVFFHLALTSSPTVSVTLNRAGQVHLWQRRRRAKQR
jgi:hypothetical protein